MDLSTLKQAGIKIMKQVPLGQYTFTKTGGPAEYLALPKTEQELAQLVAAAQLAQIPITVIGNASNLIIRDGGIDGLVVILTAMRKITVRGNLVRAQAGAPIIDTAFTAARRGLSGLEFAAGIPGSVGGAIFMNAGAYGGETSTSVQAVRVLTRSGVFKTYTKEEMHFSYRHSLVQDNGELVVSATFALQPGQKPKILAQMNYLNSLRQFKQPLEYPSCGSVFKRPAGHFVGPMIMHAGLQGKQIGGAQVSLKHAGFIVNKGNATATDYLELIQLIQQTIQQQFGVTLETEVRIIGEPT